MRFGKRSHINDNLSDFACPKGETFNKANLDCKSCPEGTFSLGGGNQHTFNELDDLKVIMPELHMMASVKRKGKLFTLQYCFSNR